jgi:hypothetical protein
MFNACLAALKLHLEELTSFRVLENEYAITMNSGDPESRYRIAPNMLPAIILNFETGTIARGGAGVWYTFPGNVIVATCDLDSRKADYNLKSYVFDASGVYRKLLEVPMPSAGGKPLFIKTGSAFPKPFRGTTENQYFLSQVIPVSLEYAI